MSESHVYCVLRCTSGKSYLLKTLLAGSYDSAVDQFTQIVMTHPTWCLTLTTSVGKKLYVYTPLCQSGVYTPTEQGA